MVRRRLPTGGVHINTLRTKEQTATDNLMGLQARYAALVSNEKQLPKERKALAKLVQALPGPP